MMTSGTDIVPAQAASLASANQAGGGGVRMFSFGSPESVIDGRDL